MYALYRKDSVGIGLQPSNMNMEEACHHALNRRRKPHINEDLGKGFVVFSSGTSFLDRVVCARDIIVVCIV
jgi:hypothetical protein